MELKLPPTDAYHKIRHTIDEVNALIAAYSGNNPDLEVRPFCPNSCTCHAKSPSKSSGIFVHLRTGLGAWMLRLPGQDQYGVGICAF